MSAPRPPAGLSQLPGAWAPEPSGLPPGGPRWWWRGPEGVLIGGSPAKIDAELAGHARLAGHPARPALSRLGEDGLLYPALGPPPEDPAAALMGWPRGAPWQATLTLREALQRIPGRVQVDRALIGLGLSRRAVDRGLNQTRALASFAGPSLGGVSGGWLRQGPAGPLALRWSEAEPAGLLAVDLAATALADGGEDRLRAFHADGLPEEAANLLFDLALLRRALDEAALGADPGARAIWARLREEPAPAQLRVSLEGPAWLDTAPWIPASGRVRAEQARWLLQHLDGLHLGGAQLHVHLDPPLRAGRRPPPREAQRARRLRLFSRWEQGVQWDEEGLYSATPEALAAALVAEAEGRVLDGTTGLGSLAIALAQRPAVRAVVAVDTDAARLAMARHNAGLYGVAAKIRFAHCSAAEALRRERFDGLVLDPPWGGPGYDRARVGLADLGLDLAATLARAPARVWVKLPRSFDVKEFERIPGRWSFRAMVDARGLIKFLVATRGAG